MTDAALISRAAALRLAAAGIDSAASDAAWLLAEATGVSRGALLALTDLTDAQAARFEELLSRREKREPLQHILGSAGFRYLSIQVGPGVFVPRPETETLVGLALDEVVAQRREGRTELTAVDLCTGSAAIPLALATEAGGLRVLAVEASADAAVWAQRNIDAHQPELAKAGSTLLLHTADIRDVLESALSELRGQVDVVTCNPPYIPDGAIPRDIEVRKFDPAVALYGGADGLDLVRATAQIAAELLRPGGALFIEHGDAQGDAAAELGVPSVLHSDPAYAEVTDHLDLTGRPRVTSARRRQLHS